MKKLIDTEQVAYQEGYAHAKKKHKNDFLYGFYTGFIGVIITIIFCLTFKFTM